jgi:hypothetical protein
MYSTAALKPASASRDRLLGSRSDLVWTPALEHFATTEEEPEVWAEEFVRGAEQDVHAGRGDVDRPVRRVVDRVDPRERAGLVRELGDPSDLRDRPDGVRRPGKRDNARTVGQFPLEVVEVEPALLVEVDHPHDELLVACELEPRRDVAIVIESRHDDLVAGAKLAAERTRKREVQRRHVCSEADLVGAAAEERGCGVVGLRDDEIAPPARLERSAQVGVGVAEAGGHRLDDRVRHLCAARPVEEGHRFGQG